ncbi:hypothetical protein ACFQFC_32220 [Amorphoplanes digitatis]|uniref:hypothetical protein n=1 Tax=Actinoplanes digitatis TaxID=1868 RepID=UPI00161DF122|nr:hypothetical protein [Actinoplanes digitatis]GID97974.1 hypothetical protein Adi01nite_73860 [Actinoplanes digitatis]
MVTEADPRERQDGLGWVTRAIFGDPGVRVAVGDDPAATVRYAVIPSLDDARFLLPLASRKVTAASLLAYNALRPPKVRAGRAAVGLLARAGALGLTRAPILSVYADAPGLLLAGFLAAELGEPELHAAIGIRPPDPHHKPTLQLFDGGGRPRGYAKIGWNDGTRAMVRAEAATLADLPVGNGFPPAPKLMLHTRWNGREIAVIAPMPRRVRRIRRPGTPRLAAMLAVARRGGPPAPPRPARDLVAGWLGRAEGGDPRIHAVIGRLDPDLELEFGDWHGDWVPWNMARHGRRLLVWDWENSAPGVPVGFDLAHQAFQTALSTHGRPAAECATAVDEALRRHGPALGLDATRQRFVADAYLVELWLRTYELSGGGAGWNPKLHPALLDVLDRRQNARAAA